MILSLRLVSKAWKAAAPKAFPELLTVRMNDTDDAATKLANVCKSLPSTASLQIQSRHILFDSSPISGLSELSRLDLSHRSGGGSSHNLLDLAVLPSGLRELRTQYWTFDSNRLHNFNGVGISSLDYLEVSQTKNILADIYKLLQLLPELTVSNPFSLYAT